MAYGALLTGGYTAKDGTDVEVYVDREGYSGTTYTLTVNSETLTLGQESDTPFKVRRQGQATTSFIADGVPVAEAKDIARGTGGTHRLRVLRDGTEAYRGFCDPQTTTLRINETMPNIFTVRAKTQIGGLEGDWVKDGGALYQDRKPLSEIIAGILSDLGIQGPLEAVIAWRPEGLTDTDHPLQVEAQPEAWRRTDQDDQTVVSERGKVLHDCLGIFGATLILEDGVWKIRQPFAYRDGSDVTVWEYDDTGTYQTSRTEPATDDISDQAWLEGTDEVSGLTPHREAAVTFEHGAPAAVDFNGSFESGATDNAVGWTLPTDFTTSSDTPTSDSDRSLRAPGDEILPPSPTALEVKQALTADATATLGGYAPGSEEVDLTYFYQSIVNVEGLQDADFPDTIQTAWALSLTGIDGTTYWLIDGQGWTQESSLSSIDEKKNLIIAGGPNGGAWSSFTITVPSPPVNGTLDLELYEGVAILQTSGEDNFTFATFWDEGSLSRSIQGASETLYRSYDVGRASGETVERSFRIGDGPYAQSPGALYLPGGEVTGSWRVVGDTSTYALHELLVKELLASLSNAPQLIRATFDELSPSPSAARATTFDGKRLWPVQVKRTPAQEHYELAVVELQDAGFANGYEIIAGGADSVESSSGSTGGGAASGDVGSWSELSGKPGGLLSTDGDSDGIAETIASTWANVTDKPLALTPPTYDASDIQSAEALDAEHVADALGYTPADETDGERLASEIVQNRQEIDALDVVTVRESETLATGTNIVFDGTLGDGTISLVDQPSVDQVTLAQQATATGEVVRADRALAGGDGIQTIGNFTQDRTVAVDDTVARTDRDESFDQDVTVIGDLYVEGTRFEANVETVKIEDNLAVINDGEGGDGVTAGFAGWEVDRGTADSYYWGFDEARDRFVVGNESTVSARQVVATREDNPTDRALAFWDDSETQLATDTGLTWASDVLGITGGAEHPDYESGFTGAHWQVTETGEMAGESLFLRGPLTVSELIVNRIHAVDGTQIIGPGRGRIKSVSGSAPTETVSLEDPQGTGVTSFQSGDLVIVQEVDIDQSTVVKRVVREVDTVDNANAEITLRDHADGPTDAGSLGEGDTLVVIGSVSDVDRQSVLVATATTSDAPYRRTLSGIDSWTAWQSADKVRTQTGNIDPLVPGSPGFGFYGASVRLTDDILVGSLDETGSYLKYSESGGLTVVTSDEGDLDQSIASIRTTADENAADIELLAKKIVQERESIAGVRYRAGKNFARVTTQAAIIGDGFDSESTITQFASDTEATLDASVQYTDEGDIDSKAAINLYAGPDGSRAVLYGDTIRLDGSTIVDGTFKVTGSTVVLNASTTINDDFQVTGDDVQLDADTVVSETFTVTDSMLAEDYTPSSDGRAVIRQNAEPSSRPSGNALQEGDIWVDTDDGDKPYTYDGSSWVQAYTTIDGGNLETGTVTATEADLTDIFAQTLTLNDGGKVDGGDTDFRHDKGLVGEADAGGADASGVRWYEAADPSNGLDAALTPRTRSGTFASLHAYSEKQLILEGKLNTAITGNLMSIPQRSAHPDKAELQSLPGGGTNRAYIYIHVDDGFWRLYAAWLEEQSDGTYTYEQKEVGSADETWFGLFADVSNPPGPSPPDDGSDDGTIQ